MKIDSHQHFWNYDPTRHSWIDDSMKLLQDDFLPKDLKPILQQNKIDGCIAVQADQSLEETRFLLQLANENDFIKGVVGWIDLRAGDIENQLQEFSSFKKLKGFRHVVQDEKQIDFLLRDDFCNGISFLNQYGFTYDILVFPTQLPSVIKFVKRFPDQPFVLDHIAKPYISKNEIKNWEKDIIQLSGFPNLYCKISGMVTEANWKGWSVADFKPYIDVVVNNFGTGRIMFGSDWPVCLVAASYQQCCEILEQNTMQLSGEEKEKLWGQNAKAFYKIGNKL